MKLHMLLLAAAAVVSVGVVSADAQAQDTTGCKISANGKYATCVISDDYGRPQTVRFKIRGKSAPAAPEACTVPWGETGTAPCPTSYGVPNWLVRLNQWFLDQGFTPPAEVDVYRN